MLCSAPRDLHATLQCSAPATFPAARIRILDRDFRSLPETASVTEPPQRDRSSRPRSSLPRPQPPDPVRPILPTLGVSALGSSLNRTRCLARLDRPEPLSIRPSLPSRIFAPRDQSARPAERSGSLPCDHDRLPFSPRQLPACLLSANGSSIQVLHRSAWLADSVNLLEPNSGCPNSHRESKSFCDSMTFFQKFFLVCFQFVREPVV